MSQFAALSIDSLATVAGGRDLQAEAGAFNGVENGARHQGCLKWAGTSRDRRRICDQEFVSRGWEGFGPEP